MAILAVFLVLALDVAAIILLTLAIQNRIKDSKDNYEKPKSVIWAFVLFLIFGIIVIVYEVSTGISFGMALLDYISSVLFTWGFPIGLSTVIRYCSVGKPLSKAKALLVIIPVYLVQLITSVAINGAGAHAALLLAATVSFRILSRITEIETNKIETEYNECPVCQRKIPKTEMFCKCGYKFDK